ncbi:adenosine deaminase [Gordonia sp. NB41Y]|uniref:adenosine deaminase n=1 Tax=Gordonia sp. NB41Y TaxID=875808 RepID=UPI0006B1F5F0|nr:adenosine deaminase [Gordonia sp. NB41Y]EMP12507.2 adenosine deaminase [Gordonia sp. NB41Y]WLP90450.1 adenosine deaminase [Gordonia sp. NB41Y]
MTKSAVAQRVDEAWIRALPKAEVHIHLEGSLGLADLLGLAKAAGAQLPFPADRLFGGATAGAGDGAETGLSSFLRFLDWGCGLVATPEQASSLAYRFAARQTASGIRYTDVIVNPGHWGQWTDRVPALFAAFADGFDEARADGLAEVNTCVSLSRGQSASSARELVEQITESRPPRVVALSIDGDEHRSGPVSHRFAEAFSLARDRGLRRTVHAGESSGPEGVRDALDHLHAERIDHGVRAVEDPELVGRLRDQQIPLGVCPRSNVALGLYPSWEVHPFRHLRQAGVAVTLNTDDPAVLGTSLETDWSVSSQIWGLDRSELRDLARTSVTASFADDDLTNRLLAEIDAIDVSEASENG